MAVKKLGAVSAYAIAVEHGYTGTETEWLASLKGVKGDKGEPGAKGDAYVITENDKVEIADEVESKYTTELGGLKQDLSELKVFVTPEMFGAYGDGVHDDTEAINNAILSDSSVILFSRQYMVSVGTDGNAVNIKSGKLYLFSNDAYLKLSSNSLENYNIINAQNVSDFSIINPCVYGDRFTHTGSTGEWGHGISLVGCADFRLENVRVYDTWGDGVTLYDGESVIKNGYIDSIYVENASRNGVTIEAGKNIHIGKIYCKNVNRISPKSCVDFEMDSNNLTWDNVTIDSIISEDCPDGVRIVPYHSIDTDTDKSIGLFIGDINLTNSNLMYECYFSDKYSGIIEINSVIMHECNYSPIITTNGDIEVDFVIKNFVAYDINHISESVNNDYFIYLQSMRDHTGGNLYLNFAEMHNFSRYYPLRIAQNTMGFKNCRLNIVSDKPLADYNANISFANKSNTIDWLNSKITFKTSDFPIYKQHTTNKFTNNAIATEYIIDDDIAGLEFPFKFPIKNHPITIIKKSAYNGNTYAFGSSDWRFHPVSSSVQPLFRPNEKFAYLTFYVEDTEECIVLNKR